MDEQENEPIKILYTCPKCGQQSIFGEHFCPADSQKKPTKVPLSKKYWISIIGSALIVILLFSITGDAVVSLIGLAVLVGLWWLIFRDVTTEGYDFIRLLKLTRGDRSLAERLILAEQNRFPDETRAQSIERAYNRLLHDRLR